MGGRRLHQDREFMVTDSGNTIWVQRDPLQEERVGEGRVEEMEGEERGGVRTWKGRSSP